MTKKLRVCQVHKTNYQADCLACQRHRRRNSPAVVSCIEHRYKPGEYIPFTPCESHLIHVETCVACVQWRKFEIRADKRWMEIQKRKEKARARHTALEERRIAEIAQTIAAREPRLNHQGTVGYVYVLTNPAFAGWVKVGSALDEDDRLNTYQTSDPNRAFIMHTTRVVENRRAAELRLHELFRQQAAEAAGEWFKIELDHALHIFRTCDLT
jgi:T5orf172 domain